MKKNKKYGIFMLVLIFSCVLMLSLMATDTVSNSDLALDVMFVIDGSGSMNYSDPSGIAKEACRLFVDMCDYGQARAGYVLFSSKIAGYQNLTEMNSAELRSMLRKAIGSIQYPKSGGTDISLGLTKAMNTLIENNSVAEGRSPMIILLSDGRAEDVAKDRENVHVSEFEDTLKFLSERGIPVYTIALNSMGSADVVTMESVAKRTGGLFFETDSADNLSDIMTKILANQLRSNINSIAEFTSDGTAQTVTIPIPNDSIYQANIIILTSKGVSNLHLREPSGNEVVIPSDRVLTSSSTCYELIKLIRPTKGDWQLTLTGVDKDQITINLINCYDMNFDLRADKYTASNGDTITFDAYCSNLVDGETDSSVFDGAEGVLTVVHNETGAEQQVDLAWTGDTMQAAVQFTAAGNYTVGGRIIGKDGNYDRPIQEISVKINPYPLALITDVSDVSKTLFSPFIGIKFMNRADFPLTDLFSWDKDATLNVTAVPGGWEEACSVSVDLMAGIVSVSAQKSGDAIINLKVSDSFGQSADYTIRVKVIPGWVPVVLLLAIIGLVIVAFWAIKKAKAPYLKGVLKIGAVLPIEMASMTPPESEIDLTALSRKGKVPMDVVLSSNLTTGGQYAQAFSSISTFVHKVEIEAGNADSSSLKVHLPAVDKSAVLQYGGMPIEKRCTKTMTINMPVVLNYNTMGSEYQITLSFASGEFGNDFTGGFNSFGGSDTSGGFGGFGGGETSGGFGSFGGSDTGSGFGSFGGGTNGGFGGNDTNGGFGSF